MKNLAYSAISYVAAALLLSGQVIASPADLSGAIDTDVSAYHDETKQSFYLALNRYPVALPPLSPERLLSGAVLQNRQSEAYIDGLQKELRDQLDYIIESQEIFTQ